jgi:hypothetical protein
MAEMQHVRSTILNAVIILMMTPLLSKRVDIHRDYLYPGVFH